jgi:16S rRNA (adenine(1408)-N(1))-methyltransferase
LHGTKIIEAGQEWRRSLDALERPVVVDLGAGDGRYVYESARADPATVYVAVDPDGDTLSEYAYRAARKPSRGGVDNALFVVAAVEALPEELNHIAGRVRVNFPWGSLLRGLLEPLPSTLARTASLVKHGCAIEIVLSYHPQHDTGAFTGPPLPPLEAAYFEDTLVPAYESAGLTVRQHRQLTQQEALAIPSTWGRRLLHSRPRDAFFIECVPGDGR